MKAFNNIMAALLVWLATGAPSGQLHAQARLILSDTVYLCLVDSVQLVITNSATNAITTVGTGAAVIPENDAAVVSWHIGAGTGIYTVPFGTSALQQGGTATAIPVSLQLLNAGVGAGSFQFSTYETDDHNQPWPGNVANLDSWVMPGDAGLDCADRFWKVAAQGYTTLPSRFLTFRYADTPQELGQANTITEAHLQPRYYAQASQSWQAKAATVNTLANTVLTDSLGPNSFQTTWKLMGPATLIASSTGTPVACDTNFLDLFAPAAMADYQWSNGQVADSISVFANGWYHLQIVDSVGAVFSDSIQVTIAPPPQALAVAPLTGPTPCDGDSIVLGATGSYQLVVWSTGDSTANTVVSQSGIYSISGLDSLGCAMIADSIAVQFQALPPIPLVSADTTYCAGDVMEPLYAIPQAGGTITWHTDTGQVQGNVIVPFNFTDTATYYATQQAMGCFSDSASVVVGIATVDAGVVILQGTEPALLALADSGTAAFQWLDCGNDLAIFPFQTNATFVPPANGSYAVQVTQYGCIDTSTCIAVTSLELLEHTPFVVRVWPNPVRNSVSVALPTSGPVNGTLTLFDALGKKVRTTQVTVPVATLTTSGLAAGWYTLQIQYNQHTVSQALVVQH